MWIILQVSDKLGLGPSARTSSHQALAGQPHRSSVPLMCVHVTLLSTDVSFGWLSLRDFSAVQEVANHDCQRNWIDYELSFFWSFRCKRRHCPGFNRSIKRSFVRILELFNIFSPNTMILCGRIFLGARFSHVILPRILVRKDHVHGAHTFGLFIAMDHFSRILIWCQVWRI